MLVLENSEAISGRPPIRANLPGLVRYLGTDQFDGLLSETVKREFRCRHMTAFSFRRKSPPRVVSLVANDAKKDAVREAAEHYAKTYWQVDPSNIFNTNRLGTGSYAVLMSDDDVNDSDFKYDCYVKTGVSHRLSLITEYDSECLKISFHRAEDAGEFDQDSVGDLLEHGDMLASLVLRHQELLSARRTDDDPDRFEFILASRYPKLTNRERRVCSLIAIGMSSEAIALTLEVSINTVLTFRRRAYARLNISTQNELLRLLYHAPN